MSNLAQVPNPAQPKSNTAQPVPSGVARPSVIQGPSFQVPDVSISAAEKLLVEQVEDLVGAGEIGEAIRTLEQLFDQSDNRVVEAESPQLAGTMVTQRYIPVREWIERRLSRLLTDNRTWQATYTADRRAAAEAALAEALSSKDLVQTRQLADRFSQTAAGVELRLLLADLYLERAWGIAAMQASRQLLPNATASQLVNGARESTEQRVPEQRVAEQRVVEQRVVEQRVMDRDEALRRMLQSWSERLPKAAWQMGAPENQATEALKRIIDAATVSSDAANREQLFAWVTAVAGTLPTAQQTLVERMESRRAWEQPSCDDQQWSTFAGGVARRGAGETRLDPSGWPTWNQTLERFGSSSDRTVASKPRVGEVENGALLYHPVVVDGRVFINELNRIAAYSLADGKPWPEIEPALPLFDSHIAPASLLPLGYPMVGMPRGTLTVANDCLYARLGSPVTAWASGETAPDGGSMSYLVGLDLKRQGSLLRGFPLRLSQFDFGGAEPEGCPLVLGESLFVAVAKRDNVGMRRSVAAFDRFSGQLLWKSPVLAVGTVDGSDRANLLSNQLLSAAGGRLFYNTNLGSVVCLDPLTGNIEWLTRYRRTDREKQAYAQPDRFRYRDLNPCLIHQGMVYCAPQDCPEIFALDATSGELIWSTDNLSVADAIHVLGVSEKQLIVSGDRLLWLDLATGRIAGRFPAAGTSGSVNGLPNPRGLGRGMITADEVYWPTANEVFVFPASLPAVKHAVDAPPLQRRIRLDTRGAEGGNLVTADGWLLIATPSRLMAFDAQPELLKQKATSAALQLNFRVVPD